MTTFTMQDLTPTKTEQATQLMQNNGMNAPTQININDIPVTKEEDEAMQALTEKQMEQLQAHEEAHKMVQGVTGAQYEVIDVKKFEQPQTIDQLINQLTQTFSQLLTAITEQKQPQPTADKSLQDAVDTVLQSAEWFKEMVGEKVSEEVSDKDFEYEIGDHVERYFRNQFDLSDHIDLDSEIERMIDNKLEEAIEDKLSNATISVNF